MLHHNRVIDNKNDHLRERQYRQAKKITPAKANAAIEYKHQGTG